MEPRFNSDNLVLIVFILLFGITYIAAKTTLKQKRKLKFGPPVVCVRSFGKIEEAEIAKNLLIANQIKADIFYDNLRAYTGRYTFGNIELKTNEEDKEAALNLLKELEKD